MKNRRRYFFLAYSILAASGLFFAAFAQLTEQFKAETDKKIDSLRKGDITILVKNPNPVAGAQVTVKQVRHHFGFGAALPFAPLKRDSAIVYGRTFSKYFEWATPENEMKWQNTDKSDSCGTCWDPDYSEADSLIAWCHRNDLKVRGHNLFWNEKPDWQPGCVLCMDSAQFRAAMKLRIDNAITHFKGKVDQWDVINEIIHGGAGGGLVVVPGYYAQMTKDTNIFSWIIKNVRAIDPNVQLAVNEYQVIEHTSDWRVYTDMIKQMKNSGGDIDIVGLEGHFSSLMNRADYSKKIDSIAINTNHKPIWLTEVDFQFTVGKEDSLEELMRYAMANKDIGGLCLWMWWQGNRWRESYTSFLVDSSFREVPLGARWLKMKDSTWTTNTSGTTAANGEFKFRGFYGKYAITTKYGAFEKTDTASFVPGSPLTYTPSSTLSGFPMVQNQTVMLNGKKIMLQIPEAKMRHAYLSTYSLSGKLLTKTLITPHRSGCLSLKPAVGCYVVRIESGKEIFLTAKWLDLQ
jgi:endo-1,4-beta-xylanase